MARLALIEIVERDGRVGSALRVSQWPAQVGRALDCDLVLDDAFAAPRHLRLDLPADGAPGLLLSVGETINGVQALGRRLEAGSQVLLPDEALVELGRTVLRIRTGEAALAPERALTPPAGRTPAVLTGVGVLALLSWFVLEQWLLNTPAAGWDHYLPALLGAAFGCIAWAGIWGLGSKLFQHSFRFLPHLRVLLAFALAYALIDALLALGAFAFSWPLLSRLRAWFGVAMLVALVATHTLKLLPNRRRAVIALAGGACLLWIGIDAALEYRHHQRLFKELYVSSLPPPTLRLAPARPVEALLGELVPLEARLQAQAREDERKDPGDKALSEFDF